MVNRVEVGNLSIAACLYELVDNEIAPGTGVASQDFWQALDAIVRDLGPKNRELLARRDRLQAQVDEWHRARKGHMDSAEYTAFLRDIGYLEPEPGVLRFRPQRSTRRSPPSRAPSLLCRSTTHAMRSTPPTRDGAACTMRFTAPMSSPSTMAPRRAPATIQCVARACSSGLRASWTRPHRYRRVVMPMSLRWSVPTGRVWRA